MKISELRLAKSVLSDNVYVGIRNKVGDAWLQKKDITNDFLCAVIERWGGYAETITVSDGTVYQITVRKINKVVYPSTE